MVASFVTNDMSKVSTTRNPNFFDQEFWSKNPPIWYFCPHVQLDKSAILDKSIWT
jgi:hypothetical protein